ncbi:YvcK family protein [Alkalicoccus chagannorensis]
MSVLLRGLKHFPVDISAVVTVADDGGSSGRLREELNIPPPGDVRNVLAALSEVEPLLEELFQHRFDHAGGLSGHSLGNLLLAGMSDITGDFAQGVQEISRVLNVKGKVIPASNEHITLLAEMKDGTIVRGESKIPYAEGEIHRVYLEPSLPTPMAEAVYAIEQADLVILGPGSLYTSIIPNLLVPGMKEALIQSTAPKLYICNVMTQPGETDGYSAADHIEAIHAHVGTNIVDKVLLNTQEIPEPFASKYETDGAEPVCIDYERLERMGVEPVAEELLIVRGNLLRHDALKVSERLVSLL